MSEQSGEFAPLAIGDRVRGVGMGTGVILTTWTAYDGTPKATVRWESGATWDYKAESLTVLSGSSDHELRTTTPRLGGSHE